VAFLQVVKPNHPEQVFGLRDERIVVGRLPSCEIVIDNAAVSRQHAQIVQEHGEFFVEDLRSRNHTYLNGARLDAKTLLKDADEVKIGDVVFRFFQDVAIVPADEGSSTVVVTLNAASSSEMRLGIHPEAKLRAVLEIGNSLSHTLELDDVLRTLLDGLFQVFPHVDSGWIVLTDYDDRRRLIRISKRRGSESIGSVQVSNALPLAAMDRGDAILSIEQPKEGSTDSGEGPSARTTMCVPLINREGRALGAIQLESRSVEQPGPQDDLDLLVSLASQAVLAIENARLHESLLRQSEIDFELTIAAQVQRDFLPHQRPNPPGYECSDFYEPAKQVGGDYFDYIALPDGRLVIGAGDVAGKGLPAALLMARLYSAVRLHTFSQTNSGKVLSALNAELHKQGMGHRFVTLVLLTLDPRSHELTIANAGHWPPIVRSPAGTARSIGRKESGMPLGIVPRQKYGEVKLTLEPGATVVIYTDGVSEAMSPSEQLFGSDRLEQFIGATTASAGELIHAIVKEVDHFCGSRLQQDDMCLVCLRRLPSP
jgi:phosphoserine phosphatase RsbU/P